MHALNVALRITLAAVLLLTAGGFGFFERSPWMIPLLGALFAFAYIRGKPAARSALGSGAWSVRQLGLIWLVQTVLAAACYLLGYGLGAALRGADAPAAIAVQDAILLGVAWVLIAIGGAALGWIERRWPASAPAARLHARVRAGADAGRRTAAVGQDLDTDLDPDIELDLHDRPPALDEIYAGRHFLTGDAATAALRAERDHRGERHRKRPRAASEGMLAEAETRLGVRFPQALRDLYRMRDGGLVHSFWVARTPSPRPVYQDWADAFANDYNELKPLHELRTLQELYEEDYGSDATEEVRSTWLSGADKMVVLAIRTGAGSALDYGGDRSGQNNVEDGGENSAPGVVLFDLQNQGDARIRARFDSFDAFLAALRRERDRPVDPRHAETVLDGPATRLSPDQFWRVDRAVADRGATDADVAAHRARTTFSPPSALLRAFRAANGGVPWCDADPELGADNRGRLRRPFPEVGSITAPLQPLENWLTLAELSDRIAFLDDRPSWAQIWRRPEALIVISAARDAALMLDHRLDPARPRVVFAADLDREEETAVYPSVERFLERLRAVGVDRGGAPPGLLTDPDLAAPRAAASTFWAPGAGRAPAEASDIAAFEARLGAPLAPALADLLRVQNGGPVRFRYLPNAVDGASVDLFPGGVAALEDWVALDVWGREAGVALPEDLSVLLSRRLRTASNVERRLYVVGATSETGAGERRRATLLDASSDFFVREASLMLVAFDPAGEIETLVPQQSLTHAAHGVVGRLRARRSEF